MLSVPKGRERRADEFLLIEQIRVLFPRSALQGIKKSLGFRDEDL